MAEFYSQVDVVLKIAERCNINCSYCYMFNRGNEDYLTHPVYIHKDIIEATAKFLAKGAAELKIKTTRIIFHGGEPLMLKKVRFAEMCEILLREISPLSTVKLSLQTNAILIDDEWIDIFEKYQIAVGVSIDGPSVYNDIERVDHQGRGTHSQVVAGLKKLQVAARKNRCAEPGLLCVINPLHDSSKIYRHFVDDLGVKRMSFLMPMEVFNGNAGDAALALGKYLCGVFDEWIKDDKPALTIRIIDQVLKFMVGQDIIKKPSNIEKFGNFGLVSIASNGDLSGDDDLKPTNIRLGEFNLKSATLANFLRSPSIGYLDKVAHSIPTACLDCCWQNYCRGGAQNGSLINRYSAENGFDNPSVFCDGLKAFYFHLSDYLLRHGADLQTLLTALNHEGSPYKREIAPLPAAMQPRQSIPIKIA